MTENANGLLKQYSDLSEFLYVRVNVVNDAAVFE